MCGMKQIYFLVSCKSASGVTALRDQKFTIEKMLDENEATQKTEMEESRKIIKGKKSGKPPIMKEMNKPPLVKEMSTEKKVIPFLYIYIFFK
ncbi:unnamed protein product [Brugia timori]|uniref:Uncharacterized protein n=1 Tax=Brugia timori TaxID=42155 RepID=A0A0R3QF99_9BILA|nr:unnamed protein product [Brugia timori]